jgi:ABC-type sugar transport system ATPase subunit
MPVELHPQFRVQASAALRARPASSVSLRGVRKAFGSVLALDGIDLDIDPGEFIALIGPSGCGKSSLLRLIAGLDEPDEGELRIAGADVADVPARERHLAMVFQAYALYPHLTVFRNLALPLEIARLDRPTVERRVERIAEILDIVHLLNRRPGLLSGGQRQRVALARALVRESPLYLLDEPLSHLDAPQRRALRARIRTLHEELGATFIYATHDQAEALAMADRVVVMNEGRIAQVATARGLCDHPAPGFVAGFLAAETMAGALDARRAAFSGEPLQ